MKPKPQNRSLKHKGLNPKPFAPKPSMQPCRSPPVFTSRRSKDRAPQSNCSLRPIACACSWSVCCFGVQRGRAEGPGRQGWGLRALDLGCKRLRALLVDHWAPDSSHGCFFPASETVLVLVGSQTPWAVKSRRFCSTGTHEITPVLTSFEQNHLPKVVDT